MRAVLDVNVLVSALLSASGTPARLLRLWQAGAFESVVSPSLLAELRRALRYPRIERYVSPDQAERFVALLVASATVLPDAAGPPSVRSRDPGDDYLIALAEATGAYLVSGDVHLLELENRPAIMSAADFAGVFDTS